MNNRENRLFVYSIFILTASCNIKEGGKHDPFDPETYIEISADSLDNDLEMLNHKVYYWKYDTSRIMLKGFWDNGQLQSISYYYKGEKDGKWVGYFEDGKVSFEGSYSKGRKNGTFRIYHLNGNISNLEHYTDGKPSGTWVLYDTLNNVIKNEQHTEK